MSGSFEQDAIDAGLQDAPEHDEPTDPDPATVVTLEEYDEGHTPGAPTREELAADTNLFGAGDDPISDDAPAETGDHTDPDGEV